MKVFYSFSLLVLVFILSTFYSNSQLPRAIGTKDLAVQCWATVETSPPAITLHWKTTDLTKQFQISRKLPSETAWELVATFTDNLTTSYKDENVAVGEPWEYEISTYSIGAYSVKVNGKDTIVAMGFNGYGYLYSGIEIPPVENNGKVILLIDETLKDAVPQEINTLEEDLNAEGWGVVRKYVPRSEKFDSANVINNKALIVEEYNKDPLNLSAVFILGRVAVPYSGNFNNGSAFLDAHPDHKGAWPADLYYGFMNEAFWTDQSVNEVSASRKENWNKPYDGKFDLSTFNSGSVDLMVGRVDFADMPAFFDAAAPYKKSEIELIKNYLDKDHNYRTGQTPVIYRGLIGDGFGMYGEGFAGSGWRSLMAILSPDSVRSGNYFTTLGTENYLWAYGCGGGSYTSCGTIGTTTDFVQKPVNATFSLLFGSYFGDWDSQNNFLRASIASSPYTLTCGWSGRPHWYMHHMGMGLPVGYSARATQNNYTTYKPNAFYYTQNPQIQAAGIKSTAIALMGDPTLKMYSGTVKPPKNLSVIQPPGYPIEVTWEDSDDADIAGYNIYRSNEKFGVYTKINSDLIKVQRKFIDTNLYEGSLYYMVKAVKLQQTNSGSFYNTSSGLRKLILATSVKDNKDFTFEFSCSPNPAKEFVNISLTLESNSPVNLSIFDVTGNLVKNIITRDLGAGSQELVWNLTDSRDTKVSSGIYLIKLVHGEQVHVQKVVVMP